MKRVREEELSIEIEDSDEGGNTANDAECGGDSNLELGFRYLEEIEEEAEKERFASLDESDWDLSLGSLDIPDGYTCSLEEKITSVLEVRHESSEKVNRFRHILPSSSEAWDNDLIGNCSRLFHRPFGAYYAKIFLLYAIIATV